MTDPFLVLTPVLVGATLGLAGFVGCDRVLGFEHVPDPTPQPQPMVDFAVDPANPPPVRNDYTGWVGTIIQPVANVRVTELGRWRSPMNDQNHQVKIVDAQDGTDVPGAIVIVSLVNQPDNAFVFAPVPSAIALAGGHSYYLLTQEVTGGDTFLDYTTTTVVPTADVLIQGAVYGNPPADPFTQPPPAGGNCYGPVNAKYTT
jgi:hypothetical protein